MTAQMTRRILALATVVGLAGGLFAMQPATADHGADGTTCTHPNHDEVDGTNHWNPDRGQAYAGVYGPEGAQIQAAGEQVFLPEVWVEIKDGKQAPLAAEIGVVGNLAPLPAQGGLVYCSDWTIQDLNDELPE